MGIMLQIHDKFLIVLIHKKPRLGFLAWPYLVTAVSDTVFELSERLTLEHCRSWKETIPAEVQEMVELAEKYSDKELYRRFCSDKKRVNVTDFLKNAESGFLQKVIRPAMEVSLNNFLHAARKLGVLVFRKEQARSVYLGEALGFSSFPLETTMRFTRMEDGIAYQLCLHEQGNTFDLQHTPCEVIANYPAWMVYDGRLYFFHTNFDGNKIKPFLNQDAVFIPQRMEQEYFKKYIRKSVRGGNVIAEGFDIVDLHPVPESLLSFEISPFLQPALVLYFFYNEKKVAANKPGEVMVDLKVDNTSYSFIRIHRREQWEQERKNALRALGLKEQVPGHWVITEENQNNSATGFIQWIYTNYERLSKQGFRIENNSFEKDYYIGALEIKQEKTFTTDWFDLRIVILFEDGTELPFTALRSHILSGEPAYMLENGKVFVIPREWFAMYYEVCEFGKADGDRFRIQRSFFPVLAASGWDVPQHSMNEEMPCFDLPPGLNAVLRPYQIEGYQWMRRLDAAGLGGCLADDMGLGKTVQTIAFLLAASAQDANRALQNNPQQGQLRLFSDDTADITQQAPSLIVMPASLVHNWYAEIRRFAPRLKVYRHTGITRTASLSKWKNYAIILTTYGTLRNDIHKLEKFSFRYVILDESQMIKNPESKTHQAVMTLQAGGRFVLSGTPVENSLLDLWAQMQFLNPGMLGGKEMFKRVFLRPLEKNNDEMQMEKLRKIIAPFVMRRTKQMVAAELPPKMEQTLVCDMDPSQQSLYEKEKSKVRRELLEKMEDMPMPALRFAVLQALTRLRQIACHPLLAEKGYTESSGKFDEVLRYMETIVGEGHKLLMFSSFVTYLDLYARELKARGIEFERLTGSTRNREEVIKRFREQPSVSVFLISLKAGGVGLNLTEADYVFILDPWWNPAAEAQAVDRTHRIGQEKNVFVYRFISRDTVEEKMLILQDRKRELAEEVIHIGENPIFKMSGKELENLLN
ncbi:MAG: DEAD/DEAH box helicase [Bacteroidia bacterium]|nr:DEAD/DEAH box helicase [Bacteroidia bacterium]